MEGLEAIKDRIIEIAKDKASDIEFASNKDIDAILKKANEEAKNITAKSEEAARKESENISKRYNSLAISQERKIILAKRQEMISQTLEDAKSQLEKMNKSEKIDLYVEILKKILAGNGTEKVQFNETDLEFASEIKSKLNKPFEIHEKKGLFLGGFIIYDDKIETNMTFEMTIKHYRDELLSIAAKELFK